MEPCIEYQRRLSFIKKYAPPFKESGLRAAPLFLNLFKCGMQVFPPLRPDIDIFIYSISTMGRTLLHKGKDAYIFRFPGQ